MQDEERAEVYGETAAHKNEQASRPKVTYNSEIN
jgi:hypothetical protein